MPHRVLSPPCACIAARAAYHRLLGLPTPRVATALVLQMPRTETLAAPTRLRRLAPRRRAPLRGRPTSGVTSPCSRWPRSAPLRCGARHRSSSARRQPPPARSSALLLHCRQAAQAHACSAGGLASCPGQPTSRPPLPTHACLTASLRASLPSQVITFIRHGEGWHNAGVLTLDSHLTPVGWEQAHALGAHLYAQAPTRDVQVRGRRRRLLAGREGGLLLRRGPACQGGGVGQRRCEFSRRWALPLPA